MHLTRTKTCKMTISIISIGTALKNVHQGENMETVK